MDQENQETMGQEGVALVKHIYLLTVELRTVAIINQLGEPS